MSMFFNHALVVSDLTWRSTKESAEAIHGVLARWGLVFGKPKLWEIKNAGLVPLKGATIRNSGKIPRIS